MGNQGGTYAWNSDFTPLGLRGCVGLLQVRAAQGSGLEASPCPHCADGGRLVPTGLSSQELDVVHRSHCFGCGCSVPLEQIQVAQLSQIQV
jgi:hypothetical protein